MYSDFGIDNAVAFRGEFHHPWFFDTYQHRLMEEFSDEFVHIRLKKTGVILQFRFDIMPTFRHEGILITSTNEDTLCIFNHKTPSIENTVRRYEVGGREKPSKTAYNGIVKYGGYIKKQYKHLMETLDAADVELRPENLKLIRESLERRREIYASE